jgi:hypothetical protein
MTQAAALPASRPWTWGDFFRGPWNLIAIPTALIGLVALTAHLVEWAPLIAWAAEKNTTWMTSVFIRSPIHIPPEWNDYIVLSFVVFVITNAGYYQRIGKLFVADLLSFGLGSSLDPSDPHLSKNWQAQVDDLAAFITACAMAVLVGLLPAYCFLTFMWFFLPDLPPRIEVYAQWPFIIAAIVSSGIVVAWRWVMINGLLFASLLIGNELYVHWLGTTELLARFSHNLL